MVTVTAHTTSEDLKRYIQKILTFHGVHDLKTDKGILLRDVVFGIVREALVKDEAARGDGPSVN